ncbi:MAG: prepilin-type N-terminal cleavage/methylation domain-containing protein, partial [Eubacteriales bacterium]|nr:prepilin-type N-terminal cleavage/methylation domain-containing protein [Eubacteriales bacterium]
MKQKRNKGFTMAEMLAVVALILILAAVAAVAVYRYRRSMRQLEYDAIAKEIFIVAQNHLTMADNQGLLGRADCDAGTKDGAEEDVWYFVYPDTDPDDTDNPNALGLMLPFGAVDETVRLGGSYVIRYQKSSARVLDVFYSAPGDQTGLLGGLGCSFSGLTQSDYTALKGYRDGQTSQKEQRKHYAGKDNSNAVIGWYGGEGLEPAKTLQAPSIRVINAERLWVEVTNPNADKNYAKLQLIITEKGNPQHRKAVLLDAASASSTIILDDITTSGKHFADPDQFPDFTPGADIEIKAVAYSSTVLANIAESPTLTTNSLFASLEKNSVTGTADVANIAYIRHLENLDPSISGFSPYELVNQYEFSAKQTADLNWASFRDDTGNRDICLKKNETGAGIASGSYYPVKPDYRLAEYDGQGHSITGVEINTPEKAGLFAELSKDSRVIPEVKNLELVDFSVTASSGGDAGALIGTSNGVKVTNVLARNSKEKDSKTDATVTTSGNAGGLIGNSGGSTVSHCYA